MKNTVQIVGKCTDTIFNPDTSKVIILVCTAILGNLEAEFAYSSTAVKQIEQMKGEIVEISGTVKLRTWQNNQKQFSKIVIGANSLNILAAPIEPETEATSFEQLILEASGNLEISKVSLDSSYSKGKATFLKRRVNLTFESAEVARKLTKVENTVEVEAVILNENYDLKIIDASVELKKTKLEQVAEIAQLATQNHRKTKKDIYVKAIEDIYALIEAA